MKVQISNDRGMKPFPTISSMKRGQIAQIADVEAGYHNGNIVMKGHEKVMELSAPYHAYSVDSPVEVRILPAGATVTLTQE